MELERIDFTKGDFKKGELIQASNDINWAWQTVYFIGKIDDLFIASYDRNYEDWQKLSTNDKKEKCRFFKYARSKGEDMTLKQIEEKLGHKIYLKNDYSASCYRIKK